MLGVEELKRVRLKLEGVGDDDLVVLRLFQVFAHFVGQFLQLSLELDDGGVLFCGRVCTSLLVICDEGTDWVRLNAIGGLI